MYHKWERPLFILVVMVFAACLLILVGQTSQSISKSFPTPAGYEYPRSEARLKYADLPRGYQSAGRADKVDYSNGNGLTYRFHPSKYGISTAISQDLIVFPDSSEAKKEFTNQISYYKSVNLTLHEEDLSNQGNKSMESFARGCREVVKQGFYNQPAAETRYCVSVSLYKNVLSVVNAHVFTDQLLTMEKYNDLVDTLNHRIITAFGQSN